MGKVKEIGTYGKYTIDSLIAELEAFKKLGIKGNTPVYLSDFEYNGKQTKFEITQVEEFKELYLFYERYESEW